MDDRAGGGSGLASYLKAALLATDAATASLMERFRQAESAVAGMGLASWEKAPGDLVTEADMASDAAIKAVLGRPETPGDIYSEEGFVDRGGGDRLWLVDPLCGTRLYAAGLGLFGVSIALIGPGNSLDLGVIALPPLKERVAAVRDRGITRNGRPWRSEAPCGRLSEVLVGVAAGRFTDEIGRSLSWASRSAGLLSLGSAPHGLFQLAAGRLGAQVFYNAGVEHLAAGAAVCRELGISITDERGAPLTWKPNAVFPVAVCAWPSLHEQVLEAIAAP